MATFTFKRDAAVTGPARGASLGRGGDIKLKGKKIGYIREPRWSDKTSDWRVYLRIASEAAPGWRNAALVRRFTSWDDASSWLKDNADRVLASFNIVPETD